MDIPVNNMEAMNLFDLENGFLILWLSLGLTVEIRHDIDNNNYLDEFVFYILILDMFCNLIAIIFN
jgi:hypothetical protein